MGNIGVLGRRKRGISAWSEYAKSYRPPPNLSRYVLPNPQSALKVKKFPYLKFRFMNFVLRPIATGQPDVIFQTMTVANHRDALHNQSRYGGSWAVDEEQQAFFYFSGCDILDPGIPEEYVLIWKDLRIIISLLDSYFTSEDKKEPIGKLYYLVIRWDNIFDSQEQDDVKRLIVNGLRSLMRCKPAEYKFLPAFQVASPSVVVYKPSAQLKPTGNDYWLASKPLLKLLILGLVAIAFLGH